MPRRRSSGAGASYGLPAGIRRQLGTLGGAVADVRPDAAWYVQGGLYRMTQDDLESLDKFEGHPHFYNREETEILLPSGDNITAVTYRMVETHNIGKPSRAYLETIIRGFFDFDVVPPPEISAAEYI